LREVLEEHGLSMADTEAMMTLFLTYQMMEREVVEDARL
jgi:hypothetical protein